MTTIEHLAVVNLRLARKCAHWRKVASCTMIALEAAANDKYKATDAKREAEAKLADAERRLRDANNDRLYHCAYCGETWDMSAIADHSKVCAKHPTRKVEREREVERLRGELEDDADTRRATEAEIRHLRAEVERLTKERNDIKALAEANASEAERVSSIVRVLHDSEQMNMREVERLRGIIGRARSSAAKAMGRGYHPWTLDLQEIEAILREADAPPPAKPRRMKANPRRYFWHAHEHRWAPTCDDEPKCEPVDAPGEGGK